MIKKGEYEDNKVGVPREHYCNQFRGMDPEEMSNRSGIPYDASRQVFSLRLLGRDIEISWPEVGVTFLDDGEKAGAVTEILLMRLLMGGALRPFEGAFLAYAEMPWGEVYREQFKGRCILRMAFGFGRDPERFSKACMAVGGVPSGCGDRSYDVEFVNGLILRLILWEADEEFPPSTQILFSDNFHYAFEAEDMAVVGDILLNTMKKAVG
jgi:hypothetical protein